MDPIALLAPTTVIVTPAAAVPVVVPSEAFADVFAQAMDGADAPSAPPIPTLAIAPTPIASPPPLLLADEGTTTPRMDVLPVVGTTSTPLTPNLTLAEPIANPPLDETPRPLPPVAATVKTIVTVSGDPKPDAESPKPLADVRLDASVAATAPADPEPSTERPSAEQRPLEATTRLDTPPEPPPPLKAAVLLEKEAPTSAPNAPVDPLDRTSKSENVNETEEAPQDRVAISLPFDEPSASGPTYAVSPPSRPSSTAHLEGRRPTQTSAAREASIGSEQDVPSPIKAIAKSTTKATKGEAPQAAKNDVSAKTKPTAKAEEVEPASEMEVGSPIPTVAQPDATGEVVAKAVPVANLASSPATPFVAPRLPDAPDLGVVPEVATASSQTHVAESRSLDVPNTPSAAPVAFEAPAIATSISASTVTLQNVPVESPTIPNVTVAAAVAAVSRPDAVATPAAFVVKPSSSKATSMGKTDAPVAASTVDASIIEISMKGDDATQDDAPKDPTPQAVEAPTVKSTATERPETGSDRPSVDRHLVVRQVADRIESLAAARPRDGVVIHLEPRDLGTVTLVVKGLASALDVQMFASDDRVRESLGASRPELAQALAPRGIELRDLKIAVAPSATGSTSAGGADANPDGRPRQSPSSTPQNAFASPAKARASETKPQRAVRASRGIDLLV